MAFTRKSLETRIVLAEGEFTGGGNMKTFRGLATDARIEKVGAPDLNKMSLKIFGMLREDMEQLTALSFKPMEYKKKYAVLLAGDEGAELSVVFKGEIMKAVADYSGAPDISFQIDAMTGSYPLMMSAPPLTVEGEAPAADVVGSLAGEMGYAFENAGVTGSLKNAVLNGSPLEKARAAADQTGAELILDDDVLVLLPPGKARTSEVPYISPATGLIGYPSFTDTGISFKCLYNPALQMGGLVEIKSVVPHASGVWRITKLTHSLSAYNPKGGAWESAAEGVSYGG